MFKQYCRECGQFMFLTNGRVYSRLLRTCSDKDCGSKGPHVLHVPGDSLWDRAHINRRRHEQQQQLRRPTPSFRHPQV